MWVRSWILVPGVNHRIRLSKIPIEQQGPVYVLNNQCYT